MAKGAQRNRRKTTALTLVTSVLVVSMAIPTVASASGHGGGGGLSTTGVDVSYPQCGSSLTSSPAFAIVGVNGGLANTLNACLGPSSSYPNYQQSELYWATKFTTGAKVAQPKVSLYVNTADPGNMYNGVPILDWPTTSLRSDPNPCTTVQVLTSSGSQVWVGANSTGCAWQYGYNMATQDAGWLSGAAGAINTQLGSTYVSPNFQSYVWWLDVETANTWQTGSTGQLMNVAVLQGMYAALNPNSTVGAVGAYSTSSQWSQITGGTPSLTWPDWIPGARTQSAAASNCAQSSFTSGKITLTQWVSRNLDSDFAC